MRRQLLLFAIVTLVILATGYLVFRLVVADHQDEDSSPPPEISDLPAPPPKPPEPELAKPARTLTVVSARGRVERRGPKEEKWHPVSPGDQLQIEESVKTGKNAVARLKVDDRSEFDIEDRSELTVREISETVHRFKLVQGRIRVDYDDSGERVIRVESADSEAVAESRAGKFVIQNSAGIVSVATKTGEVQFTARDKTVAVSAGESSSVVPGKEPSPAADIPLAVMLRVARPKTLLQRKRHTYIAGKTDVGARVHVNNIQAKVKKDGRFRVRVPLKEGKNRIQVVTQDVAGNRKVSVLPTIVVDANAPIDRMDIRWGRKDKAS